MIYINEIEPNHLWVTSDENPIGIEMAFKEGLSDEQQKLIALCDFLGLDPATNLRFASEEWLKQLSVIKK